MKLNVIRQLSSIGWCLNRIQSAVRLSSVLRNYFDRFDILEILVLKFTYSSIVKYICFEYVRFFFVFLSFLTFAVCVCEMNKTIYATIPIQIQHKSADQIVPFIQQQMAHKHSHEQRVRCSLIRFLSFSHAHSHTHTLCVCPCRSVCSTHIQMNKTK